MKDKLYAIFLTTCCIICLFSIRARGQDTTRKSYSVFKPMPKSLEREEMETDRPNVTETPHTVDAGHFQYETDIVRHQRQSTDDSKQRRWLYNQANLKIGLLKNTSLHLMVQSFAKERNVELSEKTTQTSSGFGDLTIRLKQCLFGNYNGKFSMALMPYVKLPTNKFSDNKKYEEGLMVPMLLTLSKDWKLECNWKVTT
ncbi:transporter [Mucilaginibacter terrae]|uniref:Transporter n=1 Tax=Mucilaginibacter terrae TaxID=1955052 RepID=A0ABU3GQV3_9SPHI|nr:transporter [Mucilaginibacter terrae]MDT3402163.1 hypothetical protein [Mucilaginibacter terrae]